ncbi:MAG TPA: tetratricopeptide repeat protein [Stellaceae bacterium]|nr:tetratricopeptide repeat protein [Stellaceae bacterium]
MAELGLDGKSFFVAGRFERLPIGRIERELAARGAKLQRRLGRKTDIAIVTHEIAGRLRAPTVAAVLALDPAHLLSENAFLRAIGLAPALQGKDIDEAKFLGLAGLSAEEVRFLALFDILAPADGRFGFGDVKIAQHVAGLRRRGVTIEAILSAATELRRRRRGATSPEITRLDIGPSGDLMMRIGDVLAELDGQMRFAWVQPPPDPDALFEAAEQAAASGDLATAERLYYACLSASPRDPVVRFNIGNVVRDLGRSAEAKAHYLAAIDAEPLFAEAHFNLGHLAMSAGQTGEAIAHLERAVLVEPDYADPLYNLAALYIKLDRFGDAVPLLERYIRLDPHSPWAREARKLLLACRAVLAPKRPADRANQPVAH